MTLIRKPLLIFALISVVDISSIAHTKIQNKATTLDLPPEEIFKLVSPSVFVVEALDLSGEPVALGSGVAVATDQVVTNKHVIEDGVSLRIRQGDRRWTATV